jgi:hypothetical protein
LVDDGWGEDMKNWVSFLLKNRIVVRGLKHER